MVQRWKFPELASVICGSLISHQDHGKAVCLPGAIVCAAQTCFQAGCKGQNVGDIMSQLVPGGSQGYMCWSCGLPDLTRHRIDLLGSWNVLGPFLSGLSKQMSTSGVSSSCKTP